MHIAFNNSSNGEKKLRTEKWHVSVNPFVVVWLDVPWPVMVIRATLVVLLKHTAHFFLDLPNLMIHVLLPVENPNQLIHE
jgi:hypothetical protein